MPLVMLGARMQDRHLNVENLPWVHETAHETPHETPHVKVQETAMDQHCLWLLPPRALAPDWLEETNARRGSDLQAKVSSRLKQNITHDCIEWTCTTRKHIWRRSYISNAITQKFKANMNLSRLTSCLHVGILSAPVQTNSALLYRYIRINAEHTQITSIEHDEKATPDSKRNLPCHRATTNIKSNSISICPQSI